MGEKSRGNWRVGEPKPVYAFEPSDLRIDTYQGGHYAMRITHVRLGLSVEGTWPGGSMIEFREGLLRELDAKVREARRD